MRKFYLFLLLLCMCKLTATAQQKLIDVNFIQAGIEQFAAELEQKSGAHFYYDAVVFDSLRVTMQTSAKTLPAILEVAFKGTDYHFIINGGNEVYLTRGREISTTLASGFFGETLPGSKGNRALQDMTTERRAATKAATIENKLYEVGIPTNDIKSGTATMAGYIRDSKTGEPVIGASIYVQDAGRGVATDQFGFYSLTLPRGKHIMLIKAIGAKDTRRQFVLYTDGKLNIDLQEQVLALREVKISGEKIANVKGLQMGTARMDIKRIREIPAVFGEADVLRAVLTLPGVKSVGEATTGFNVRGGSADQNLILLNDATIYNPSHFFGFFSAFNPDVVRDVELYKSTIPEKFGGRLASVLDVSNREGNKKQFTGSAGIGLLTSRLSIEAPLVKDKTSFIFGGRTTYSDWLLKSLPQAYKNSQASFYDFNFDLSHQFNDKNNLYIYSYLSKDRFKLNSDTSYGYANKSVVAKYKHTFNNKFYGVLTGGFSRYDYNVGSAANAINAYDMKFDINQTNAKLDFSYFPSTRHTITFGASSLLYRLHPGSFNPDGDSSLVVPNIVPGEQALESGVYAGDKFDITDRLSLSAGLRFSLYNYLGPRTVNNYAPNLPRGSATLLDSTRYGNNKIINTYSGPEVRLSARYSLTDDMSVKAAFNTMRQYIHLLTNTTAISPTDVYKLSDPNIRPQFGSQISLGLYRNFKNNTIETSIEGYYKKIKDYLDYKSGATLLLNHHIETDVVSTQGKAYGVEFLIRKNSGKLNGTFSYTYSRTFLRQTDSLQGAPINNGAFYAANYDKPHDFNLSGNYRISHRYSFSVNMVYSTGRPITLPIAKYYYAGSERVYYSDRNQYRIPDYFRTDLSIILEGNHRIKQLTHSSWTFGVYNISGRANAYSTYFTSEAGRINGYKLSIFATAIPFINYNIKF